LEYGQFLEEGGVEQTLSRRERKKQETRQAILEAAVSLFHEKGFDETTIEEITARADVAKGTFFNYFGSKDALLVELRLWGIEQARAALDVEQGAPASPVARIKLLMQMLCERADQDLALSRQAFAARLCSPPPPPPHRAKRRLHGLFVELVTEAQTRQEIRADVDVEVVSDLLHLLFFRRMWAWARDNGEPTSTEDMSEMIDLLLDGLGGPNWRQE
jgi:AcrR family transcriptional regulator